MRKPAQKSCKKGAGRPTWRGKRGNSVVCLLAAARASAIKKTEAFSSLQVGTMNDNKPKSPVLRTEQVKASCGHMTDFKVYDDKKDQRFREQRRAKTAGRPCPACRQKAHEEQL